MNSTIIVAEIGAGAIVLGIIKDVWIRKRTEISEKKESDEAKRVAEAAKASVNTEVETLKSQVHELSVESEAYKFAARDLPEFLMSQIKALQDEKSVAERERFVAEWRTHELEEELKKRSSEEKRQQ